MVSASSWPNVQTGFGPVHRGVSGSAALDAVGDRAGAEHRHHHVSWRRRCRAGRWWMRPGTRGRIAAVSVVAIVGQCVAAGVAAGAAAGVRRRGAARAGELYPDAGDRGAEPGGGGRGRAGTSSASGWGAMRGSRPLAAAWRRRRWARSGIIGPSGRCSSWRGRWAAPGPAGIAAGARGERGACGAGGAARAGADAAGPAADRVRDGVPAVPFVQRGDVPAGGGAGDAVGGRASASW